MLRSVILVATALAAQVDAHGYLHTFTLDRVDYEGYDRWTNNRGPNHIGWSFTTEDEGPELDISSPNMAYRRDAELVKKYGKIAAGGQASFFWTSDDKGLNPDGWAHSGPLLTYIAPCNGECTTIDETTLKWTKIAEAGFISGPANVDSVWAMDNMRENGGISSATIPKSLAPGKYVLRNELIALHRAHLKEPEFYMQCGNVEVTGSGTDNLSGSGVVAMQLYSRDDNIFGFDVYNAGGETTWKMPGPPLYSGGSATGGGSKPAGNWTWTGSPERTPAPEEEDGEELSKPTKSHKPGKQGRRRSKPFRA